MTLVRRPATPSSVAGDASSVEGDAGSVESGRLSSLRNEIGELQSEFRTVRSRSSAKIARYQTADALGQAQVSQAAAAANASISTTLSTTNGYIDQANADTTSARARIRCSGLQRRKMRITSRRSVSRRAHTYRGCAGVEEVLESEFALGTEWLSLLC